MKLESRKEEQPNAPLSTATLAHADDRPEPENRAQASAHDPLARREGEAAVREADRTTTVDGGPTLVQPRTPRTGESGGIENRIENRMEGGMERQPGATERTPEEEQNTPLLSEPESRDLFAKWDALQVGFIDEPRRAVEQADNLVATTMKRTAEIFAQERARLEGQWDLGDNVSTEDLRIALRRYRSFFRRLLAI